MGKPHCTKCGRTLTDHFSIAIGMGPECRGGMSKKGWKFPKPTYRVHKGRVELVGMTGKVEPPVGEPAEDGKVKLVRSVLEHGGSQQDAAGLLQEYMEEHDSHVTMKWCEWYVAKVIKEIKR